MDDSHSQFEAERFLISRLTESVAYWGDQERYIRGIEVVIPPSDPTHKIRLGLMIMLCYQGLPWSASASCSHPWQHFVTSTQSPESGRCN